MFKRREKQAEEEHRAEEQRLTDLEQRVDAIEAIVRSLGEDHPKLIKDMKAVGLAWSNLLTG